METSIDDLNNVDWVPIPQSNFIMKYAFNNTGYHIVATNLTTVHIEKISDAVVMDRFMTENPFAKMKLQLILENVKTTLEKYLSETDEEMMDEKSTGKIVISVHFPVKHIMCRYDIKLELKPAKEVTHYVTGPTILNALLCQRKIKELARKISTLETASASLVDLPVTSESECGVDNAWLQGQEASPETLTRSFLELQQMFKDLCAENLEANAAAKKAKKDMAKKLKPQENKDESIKYDDEGVSIQKEENRLSASIRSETVRSGSKRRKIFRI